MTKAMPSVFSSSVLFPYPLSSFKNSIFRSDWQPPSWIGTHRTIAEMNKWPIAEFRLRETLKMGEVNSH